MTQVTGTTGNDTLSLSNKTDSFVISALAGNDTIAVNNITGNISADLGTGTDNITLTNVTGTTTITAADAGDVINLNQIQGNTSITLGGGTAVADASKALFYYSPTLNGFNNVVEYDGAHGSSPGSGDLSIIGNATTAAKDYIWLDNLGNEAYQTHINVTVKAGAGDDLVEVYEHTGLSTLDLGTGRDVLNLGNQIGDSTITAADAGDVINLSQIQGNTSITLGGGTALADTSKAWAGTPDGFNNVVEYDGAYGINFGDLSIIGHATTAAKDYIRLDNLGNEAYQNNINVTVKAGAGDDRIDLTKHVGIAKVDLGTGRDALSINGQIGDSTITAADAGDVINLSQIQGNTSITLGGGTALADTSKAWAGTPDGFNNVVEYDGAYGINFGDLSIIGHATTAAKDYIRLDNLGNEAYQNNINVTVKAGAGDDRIDLTKHVGIAKVDLGTGRDALSINGQIGDSTITAADAGDVINLSQIQGNTSITLGGGTALADTSKAWAGTPDGFNNVVEYDGAYGINFGDLSIIGHATTAAKDYIRLDNLGNEAYQNNINVTVKAGAGDDRIDLTKHVGIAKVDLGTGRDALSINGQVGDTTITAADAGDTINLSQMQGLTTLTLGAGTADMTVSVAGNAAMFGSGYRASNTVDLSGTVTDFTATGNSGNDFLHLAAPGNVTLNAGAGNDAVVLDDIAAGKIARLSMGDGNDYVIADGSNAGLASINGGNGNDVMVAKELQTASINGAAGLDIIMSEASNGSSTLAGGADGGSRTLRVGISMRSDLLNGVGATAGIYVDGTKIATQAVNNATAKSYYFNFDSSLLTKGQIDVVYENDASDSTGNRNLYAGHAYINRYASDAMLTSTDILTSTLNAATAKYDLGTGTAATDGANFGTLTKQTDGLYAMTDNGAMRYQTFTANFWKGDILIGKDNDTYLLNRGYGIESIDEHNARTTDKLKLGSDVAFDQLWFTKNADGYYVAQIIGTEDRAIFRNSNGTALETIVDGSGKTLAAADFDKLVSAMASMTPPPMGQVDLTAAQHTKLDTVLAANWH
jgi:hypothetical protein